MVRTKADSAMRVAAGGKAPKKNASKPVSNFSPSGHDKGGKDNLPGNRACPRETPVWQKKITFFYDKNACKSSEDSGESSSQKSDNSKSENNMDKMDEEDISILESSKVDEFESMETDE